MLFHPYCSQQVAQLSLIDRAMLHVVEDFTKSHKVTQCQLK